MVSTGFGQGMCLVLRQRNQPSWPIFYVLLSDRNLGTEGYFCTLSKIIAPTLMNGSWLLLFVKEAVESGGDCGNLDTYHLIAQIPSAQFQLIVAFENAFTQNPNLPPDGCILHYWESVLWFHPPKFSKCLKKNIYDWEGFCLILVIFTRTDIISPLWIRLLFSFNLYEIPRGQTSPLGVKNQIGCLIKESEITHWEIEPTVL